MNVSTIGKTPAPPPAPRPKLLAGLTAKRLDVPLRVLVYGQAGVGKSTFAASAPSPIFLGSEDGTAELEVVRYPKALASGDDILEAIDVLTEEPHDFQTVVLDTVDWAEPLVWETVCRVGGKTSIEAFGYGKGYVAAQEFWLRVLKRFDVLRERRRMHVVLLGHSAIRTFKNPAGEDYDHFTLKMHEKTAGILREWCDDVLYAAQEKFAVSKEGSKAKAITSGERVLYTRDAAVFFAKNRHSLPERLPLQWAAFFDAVKAARPEDPAVLAARIESMVAEYRALDVDNIDAKLHTAEFVGKVEAAVKSANGSAVELTLVANLLSVRLQTKKEQTR